MVVLSLAQGTVGEFHFHWVLLWGLKGLLPITHILSVLLLVFEDITWPWLKLKLLERLTNYSHNSDMWEQPHLTQSVFDTSLITSGKSRRVHCHLKKMRYLLVFHPFLGCMDWKSQCIPRATEQKNYLFSTAWRNVFVRGYSYDGALLKYNSQLY